MMITPLSLTTMGRSLVVLLPLLMLAGPAPLDIGAVLIGVLFILHTIRSGDRAWLGERWVQLAGLICLYMCLRSLFTDDIAAALGRSASFLRYPLLAAALAFWVLPDARTQRRLWISLAIAIGFLILDCFWQYIYLTDITGREVLRLYNDVLRLTGPFSNPRVGITIVWLLFPVLLPLLASGSWKMRGLGMVGLLGSAAAIYLSGERTAMLLWMLGIALTLVLARGRRVWVMGAVVLAAMVLAGLSAHDGTLIVRQYHETKIQALDFADSTYGRTWSAAITIARAHPFFGVGSKNFQAECRLPAYGPTDAETVALRCPMHTHNTYLEWLVEWGGVGLFLFMALIAVWVRDHRNALRYASPLMLALVITMLVRLWPVSVTPSQFVAWSAVPFWMVVGWLYACIHGDNVRDLTQFSLQAHTALPPDTETV